MRCKSSLPGSLVALLVAGLCLVGCGGVAIDDPEEEGASVGNAMRSGRQGAEPRSVTGEVGSGVGEPASVFERQLGSVSDGRCEARWESIGLNRFVQRRQWSPPELRVDCDTETQILTTESVQNGFPLRLTFVFQAGELLSATHTAFAEGFEFNSDLNVERIRFEDLSSGRRRIEFEGSFLLPQGDPVDARGVGEACQPPVSC